MIEFGVQIQHDNGSRGIGNRELIFLAGPVPMDPRARYWAGGVWPGGGGGGDMYAGGGIGAACFFFLNLITRTVTATARAIITPIMTAPINVDVPGFCPTSKVVVRTRGLKLGVTQLPDSLH